MKCAGIEPINTRRTTIDDAVIFAVWLICFLWMMLLFAMQISLRGVHFFQLPRGDFVHDFAYFWGGGRLYWNGHVDWIFNPALFNAWLNTQIAPHSTQLFSTWSYPPTMLLLMLPFALLPLPIAFLLWNAATIALLAWTLFRITRDATITILVVASPATLYSLYVAQNGALTAALLIAAIWAIDRRPAIAGICCGLFVIKPQLAILLPFAFAAGRYWTAFVTAAVVAVLVMALTLPLFGIGAWIGFFQNTVPTMTAQLLHPYGIPPQFAMPTMFVTLQGWGAPIDVARLSQFLSTAAALCLIVRAWYLPQVDKSWRNALTCAVPLLAAPYGYIYDLAPQMLAIALFVQAGFSQRLGWLERIVFASAWIWPAIGPLWAATLAWPPIGGFLLLAVALCLWRRLEQAAPQRSVKPIPVG